MPVKNLNLRIIFNDGYCSIVFKPPGIASEGTEDSAQKWIQAIAKTHNQAHRRHAILIGRLDKPASGLLLFAHTKDAAHGLQQQMAGGKIDKIYLCKVLGNATPLKDKMIVNYLKRDENGKKSIVTDGADKAAKYAALTIKEASFNESTNATLLTIKLITGRYHQIRCQLSHLGFAIIGDGLYGKGKNYTEIKLSCTQLGFNHPKTGEYVVVTCPAHF